MCQRIYNLAALPMQNSTQKVKKNYIFNSINSSIQTYQQCHL